MTDQMTYDVAIVGYGPVGVTAANLLGQMGLNGGRGGTRPEHLCAGPCHLAQQVGSGDADRSVAHDRNVVSHLISHDRLLRFGLVM